MARLFGDEQFPHPAIDELRRAGHNVLTIQDLGKASRGVSDAEVLELAAQDSRAILTFNRRHFRRLHRIRPDHPGIIACTYDTDYPALATRIDDAIKNLVSLSGHLILIYRPHK